MKVFTTQKVILCFGRKYIYSPQFRDVIFGHNAQAPSTLLPFRLKTHTFLCVFTVFKRSKTEMFIYENGGFRKRFQERRLLKTQVYQKLYATTQPQFLAGATGGCVLNRKKRPSRAW